MADDANLTAGDGTLIVAADEVGGVKYQRVKATWGPDGTANDADVATGKPLPIQVRSSTGLIPVGEPTDAKSTATDATSASLISIAKQISASAQLSATAAKQPALGTAGTASTDVISVQGIASGTALPTASAQSGTWTVQPGNTANTTAWKVDGSAVTQPTSVADGSSVTLGSKADAKSTATDTTSVSAMSVLKQVSASTQAAAASVAGTLTVATHAVTQSGTWTVQPGNTANTTAWKVDNSAVTQPISAVSLPLPTGAASLAKQPALGTAGTASADVISVQGIASGTALAVSVASVPTHAVTQSGTWTVQPGNTANTTAWKVDGSAVTQPASVATIGTLVDSREDDPDVGSASLLSLTRGEFSKIIAVYTQLVSMTSLITSTNAKLDTLHTDISAATEPATNEWETVAASQTDQALGATGATGDTLAGVIIIPATTSPGAVSIKDGGGSAITIFTGGASSVSNLVPFPVDLGLASLSGAWKVTTGSNVSVIAVGAFT